MKRLFVLNGGASVKPDNRGAALYFKDPLAAFEQGGINTGDLLVYDATLKELNYDSVVNLQFAYGANEKLWPEEGSYDMAIVRGSNYLTETVDLGHMVPLLKRMQGPIVAIGVGAQAGKYKKLAIPPGTVEAWRIIASKCESIGVRGFYSAEIFNDIGIKNVRVIGCPSFYRSRQPSISIRPIDPAKARIGLTLNKYLADDYASNATKTNRMQRALIDAVAKRPGSRFYSQGEREETLAIFLTGEKKAAHIRSILARFKLTGHAEAEAMLTNRMTAFFDIDEWANDAAKNVDVMVGFRLHGNVIALHQGIPAIYFTYDSRIRELAALSAAPSIEVEDFMPVNLEAMLERADFSKTEAAYRRNYAEYYRFLTENGLSHELAPPVHEGPQAASASPNLIDVPYEAKEVVDWFRSEVDFVTHEVQILRDRAWNLELALRAAEANRTSLEAAA
jgi:hypothetical protein